MGAVNAGRGTRPSASAAPVAVRMPISTAPVTPRTHSAAITTRPSAAISALGSDSLPGCSRVAGLSTTQPAP